MQIKKKNARMEEVSIEELKSASHKFLKMLKKQGADDIVLSVSAKKSSQIKFSNSKINVNMLWQDCSMSVFASFKKRIVTTLVKDFDDERLRKNAAMLSKFARSTESNSQYMGIAEGPFRYKKIEGLFDSKICNLGEKSVDYVEDAISKASVGRVKRTAGVFEAIYENSHLLTSNNVEAEEQSTGIYFSIRAIIDNDESAHSVTVSRTLAGFNTVKCAEEAAEIANERHEFVSIEPGSYDIIFYPLPFAVMLNLTADACSIFNVEAGISFLQNMLGKKIANPCLSLTDDATMPYGFGSGMCDDEGVPTQRNALIEKGALKTYLHNTSTAKRYHTKTTANAGLIAPHHFNLILEKGRYALDELISRVKKGLVITNLWYTRFQNYRTGEFSTMPRDKIFVIEDGRIKSCTRGIRIADAMPNLLKNVAAIGKDTKQILGWEVETPVTTAPVLVKNMNVTKPLTK